MRGIATISATSEKFAIPDQYESIATHTNKGVEFLERLGHFVRDRSNVEIEYASKLRRLVKSYQLKKKEEDELQFSTCRAFRDMLQEVGYVAGQHEVIAENLTTSVVREIQNQVRELKDERKKSLQEGARLQNILTSQLAALERSKKSYEKAWRDAEKAQDTFQKADADLNLSRAEVEKHRNNNSIKSQQCEEAKNEYAAQLQRTNELQRQHYNELMPSVFMSLRNLDNKRIQNYQAAMRRYVEVERDVEPIISKCLDGVLNAADAIEEDEDSRLVIEKFKSGFPIPGDFPFEDLSAMKSGESSTTLNGGGSGDDSSTMIASSNGGAGESSPASANIINGLGKSNKGGLTLKGTLSASRLKKRGGIFGIFGSHKNGNASPFPDAKEDWSELPPNQRRKKVQQKLEELNAKIQQETATRDALMRMKEVYTSSPALGDPASTEGQLSESGVRLDRLRKELVHYQHMLEETANPAVTPGTGGPGRRAGLSPPMRGQSNNNNNNNHSLNNRTGGSTASSERHSLSDEGEESLSRSASDSSVSNPANPHAPLPKAPMRHVSAHGHKSQTSSNGSSNSPESGLGMSRVSLPDSENGGGSGSGSGGAASATHDVQEEDAEYFYDDNEALTILGTCRALYSFDAQSEGSIPMCEGEDLQVIELDQGDGWTRVRRVDQSEEGFVPTSYIEISLRGSC